LITVSNTSTEAKEVLADFQTKLGRKVTHFGVSLFLLKIDFSGKSNFSNELVATNSEYKSFQTVCSA